MRYISIVSYSFLFIGSTQRVIISKEESDREISYPYIFLSYVVRSSQTYAAKLNMKEFYLGSEWQSTAREYTTFCLLITPCFSVDEMNKVVKPYYT